MFLLLEVRYSDPFCPTNTNSSLLQERPGADQQNLFTLLGHLRGERQGDEQARSQARTSSGSGQYQAQAQADATSTQVERSCTSGDSDSALFKRTHAISTFLYANKSG